MAKLFAPKVDATTMTAMQELASAWVFKRSIQDNVRFQNVGSLFKDKTTYDEIVNIWIKASKGKIKNKEEAELSLMEGDWVDNFYKQNDTLLKKIGDPNFTVFTRGATKGFMSGWYDQTDTFMDWVGDYVKNEFKIAKKDNWDPADIWLLKNESKHRKERIEAMKGPTTSKKEGVVMANLTQFNDIFRELFKKKMDLAGIPTARGGFVNTYDEALFAIKDIGFPVIIRPSFTLGGTGGAIAYNAEDFKELIQTGLSSSPINEVLIEQSLIGWKEFEMEVVRDSCDNAVIVCSIENVDPMGVHTGDSITVAPAQTLTDKEYQEMRDASFKVLRRIGVETGGSNVQFAQDPETGRLVVIEMNPRVSRSSALASKATGFPIAKVAALLAVGYTLDELKNDITDGKTPASFEPTIDYVVTKIPRFNFEKFPETDPRLTTQMKSVGEVMAIGRNFQESFQKAIRSMENGLNGLSTVLKDNEGNGALKLELSTPGEKRLWFIADAFRRGWSMDEVFVSCKVDKWFLHQIKDIVDDEISITKKNLDQIEANEMKSYKKKGFSDARIANLLKIDEQSVREHRYQLKVHPVFKRVDSCAAEFDSTTNYLYSTYDEFNESEVSSKKKIVVLGSGPNRIGQGIEFDYCCVQAALAFREENIETIMINSNPETVSTDFDVSDKLYFEPIVAEDVFEIIRHENPYGVVVQFGGQTPLKLTDEFEKNGVKILGTPPSSIDTAENREKFKTFLSEFNFLQPENTIAQSVEDAKKAVEELSYPVIVRPSYVLGGRAMELIYTDNDLNNYLTKVANISSDNPL